MLFLLLLLWFTLDAAIKLYACVNQAIKACLRIVEELLVHIYYNVY